LTPGRGRPKETKQDTKIENIKEKAGEKRMK